MDLSTRPNPESGAGACTSKTVQRFLIWHFAGAICDKPAVKCPACYNELSEIQVGALKVDVCRGGCGGIWFDAFELNRVDEDAEAAGDLLLNIPRDPALVVESSRKRECPRCPAIKLHRHFFSGRRRVQVDQCPNCAGYWLDAGELAAIREERRAAEQARVHRPVTSGEVIRYVYTLQTKLNGAQGGRDEAGD